MITVQVDGSSMLTDVQGMKTMGELIELVKASIDPDSIITGLALSGDELTDSDWQLPLSAQRGRVLEVTTGSRQSYVGERLGVASQFMAKIGEEFSDAAERYLQNDWQGGNAKFSVAVEDLLAFVNWYSSVLLIEEDRFTAEREEFQLGVDRLKESCEKLLQLQLRNSWTGLGAAITSDLNGQLRRFEAFCDGVAQRYPV